MRQAIVQARRNQWGGGGDGGAAAPPPPPPPQIFAKDDYLPIDNDSEKEKGAKKYKPPPILWKPLVTLLLSTSRNA